MSTKIAVPTTTESIIWPRLKIELGEDRAAPQEAGRGAEQEHRHHPHRRQEEDGDDEVGLVEVHRLGFLVAQDAQRVGPPDRDRHRESEDHRAGCPSPRSP